MMALNMMTSQQQQQHGVEQQSEKLIGETGDNDDFADSSAVLQEDGPGPAAEAGFIADQRPATQQGTIRIKYFLIPLAIDYL